MNRHHVLTSQVEKDIRWQLMGEWITRSTLVPHHEAFENGVGLVSLLGRDVGSGSSNPRRSVCRMDETGISLYAIPGGGLPLPGEEGQ